MPLHNCQTKDGSAANPRVVHFFTGDMLFSMTRIEQRGQRRRRWPSERACHHVEVSCWQLAGWFQAVYTWVDRVLCMLSSAKLSASNRCFNNSGLLGRCWASASQVAGSLFVVKVARLPYLIGRGASISMVRVELPAGSAPPLHL